MSARLKHSESGAQGARRITRSQIRSALQSLSPNSNSDRCVHAARKDLKKARAALRLLRDALGKPVYEQENRALRDAARPLSAIRDKRVLLDAFSALLENDTEFAATLRLTRFARALSEESRELSRRHARLRKACNTLRAVRGRADDWSIDRRGWSIVGKGLKRTYSKGRRAFEFAASHPTTERLHEWRKQTKYFGFQLQIFEPLKPRRMSALARDAGKIASLLGDDHDLAVLKERAVRSQGLFPSLATYRAFLTLIEDCRTHLQNRALQLGRRLYDRKPGAFATRVERYWRHWRHA